jgi:hypothetical protein
MYILLVLKCTVQKKMCKAFLSPLFSPLTRTVCILLCFCPSTFPRISSRIWAIYLIVVPADLSLLISIPFVIYQPSCHSCVHIAINFKCGHQNLISTLQKPNRSATNSSLYNHSQCLLSSYRVTQFINLFSERPSCMRFWRNSIKLLTHQVRRTRSCNMLPNSGVWL